MGSKEDSLNVNIASGSVPPNKNDLTNMYVAYEYKKPASGTCAANGCYFLYLGWERAQSNGSANVDFELNQRATPGLDQNYPGAVTLNRTAGDLLDHLRLRRQWPAAVESVDVDHQRQQKPVLPIQQQCPLLG
jgi:hypothetical protein